jgi:TonB-linked SusC/RagA family outer membrane protein
MKFYALFKDSKPNRVPLKLLRVMKITFILLIVSILEIKAEVYAQKLNLSKKNAPLEQIFKEIRKQNGYNFLYNPEMLNQTKPISITVNNASLEEVLQKCFQDQPVTYVVTNNTVVVSKKPAGDIIKQAKDIKITGRVVDTKDLPLPLVTIKLKGTNIGAVTDQNGNYTINVPDGNAVLVFSFMSFVTQEIMVNNRNVINVRLAEDVKSLEDVIVVGYGTQKKANITGAIATFNTKNLEERPLIRVDQALVGQMAGVHVSQTTGVPGRGFSIQVRGTGSITASNEPLYVIDGFPLAVNGQNSNGGYTNGNPLDNINPNDIESIQVLKDASAAAIYGSRAANGVVLITTKQGRPGNPRINVNVYTGLSQTSKKLDLLSGDEWISRATELINAQWVASGPGRTATQTTTQRRAILGLANGQFNTNYMLDDRWALPGHPGLTFIDWQDELFRKAVTQSYQLSASGANDIVKYYISGNYNNMDGIIVNQNYKSYSFRANIDITLSKKIKLGLNLAPSYSMTQEPGKGGGGTEGKDNFLQRALISSPVTEDTSGVNTNIGKNNAYLWATTQNSPVALAKYTTGKTKNFRTIGTMYAEYHIIPGLNLRSSLNLDNADVSTNKFSPDSIQGVSALVRQTTPGINAYGSYTTYRLQTFVNENTLSFNKTTGRHDISAVAGMSYNTNMLTASSLASSGGYLSDVITTLNGAANISGTTNNYTTSSVNNLVSYFGRLQYGYNNRYLFTASLRRDGSSRFGTNTKWGFFPSASVGWRISEEKFMKDITFVSELKFRASWGRSGNNNIGDYNSIATLGASNYTFGGSQAGGQAPNTIADPNLSWEKSETYDAGFDLGILKDRIYVSFDYYSKKNTALLLNTPVPLGSGFGSALTNIGALGNKGLELELTTRNLTGKFQWTTSANISHNSNKVLQLGVNNAPIQITPNYTGNSFTLLQVGLPIYSINVIKTIGLLTPQDIASNVAIVSGEQAGDPKYYDANNDGKIDANDRIVAGHPNPDYTYGVTNTFRYKSFDLSVLVQGQSGGSIYSLLGRAVDVSGAAFTDNQLGIYRDRYTVQNANFNAPRGKTYSPNYNSVYNTDWLYSSNYVRVRNITLGYNLNSILSKKLNIQGARVYMTMENWFGHDSYNGGYNAEAQTSNVSGDSKFPVPGDYGGMPLAKSVIFGINFTL